MHRIFPTTFGRPLDDIRDLKDADSHKAEIRKNEYQQLWKDKLKSGLAAG